MIAAFKKFIEKEKLFLQEDTILLTVSGGIDSVVLCELFYQSNYKFAIAHCNFHLRGDDSNGDELFVSHLAQKYNVPFHCQYFQTKEYAKEKGISIQMAARDLRYAWFKELMQVYSYPYAATGHHRDDNIETFFINILRGTGIRGLRAILPKQNKFIHPLLFAGRADIVKFCNENNLTYREDISNADTKYERNKIRHEIIPVFRDISSNFDVGMARNIEHFRDTEIAMQVVIENVKKEVIHKKGNTIYISIQKLIEYKPIKFYLFEILYDYGFNESTVEDIVDSFNAISGKQFLSSDYKLVKDRGFLILNKLKTEESKEDKNYSINAGDSEITEPIPLSIRILPYTLDFEFKNNPNIAYLDYKKLQFPLHLRKWEKGDFFIPLGMNGKKKLSDFFSNLKLSIFEKENLYLLCSGKNIVWIVGKRIDNRFKIDKKTKHIVEIIFK